MSAYSKPYLTFKQQLALLKARGLNITDDAAALSCLHKIGYYRLSAYWYPLRQFSLEKCVKTGKPLSRRLDTFQPGSSFEQALSLYVFDKRLRLLVLDAVERIEMALRVDVSYLLGAKDPFAHTNPDLLHGFDVLADQPSVTSRLFAVLSILQHFVRIVNPNSTWSTRLREHLENFPIVPHLSLADMGFPADWQREPLWQIK